MSGEEGVLELLATALRTDVPLLLAVAEGRVSAALAVESPGGGCCRYSSLESYQDEARAVALVGDREKWYELERKRRSVSSPPARLHKLPKDRYFVYRLMDAFGELVYIGSTRDPNGRVASHRKRWGASVVATAVTVEYPSAETMLAAERKAIAKERPPLNIAGVQ